MDQLQRAIQSDPANKTCIDCGAPHPQWASINNGVFFCLECSGVHRSLGVQTSFVRSITMDRWTDAQIQKMQLGGNSKALAFWRSRPDYREGLDIRAKYNSEFARLYREKLAAELEGRVFEPKPQGQFRTSPTSLTNPHSPSSISSYSTMSSGYSTRSSVDANSSSSQLSRSSNEYSTTGSVESDDWFSKFKGYAKNIGGQLNESLIQPATTAVKNSQIAQKAVEYIKNAPGKAQSLATERWRNGQSSHTANEAKESESVENAGHDDENWTW